MGLSKELVVRLLDELKDKLDEHAAKDKIT